MQKKFIDCYVAIALFSKDKNFVLEYV